MTITSEDVIIKKWNVEDINYPGSNLAFSSIDPYREDIPFLYHLPFPKREAFEKKVLLLEVNQSISSHQYKYTRIS